MLAESIEQIVVLGLLCLIITIYLLVSGVVIFQIVLVNTQHLGTERFAMKKAICVDGPDYQKFIRAIIRERYYMRNRRISVIYNTAV